MSFMDKIDLSVFDFPVELVPVYTRKETDGGALIQHNEVGSALARAVVRTDTGDALGIVGSKWTMARYTDQLYPVLKALDESGLDTGNITVKPSVLENGAMMELEIMFTDRQFDVGTTKGYRPDQPAYYNTSARVGDTVAQVLRFRNSYNGAWSFETSFGGKRLRCLNGVWVLDSIATHRRKHTVNLSVTASVEKVVNGIHMFDTMRDELVAMTQTPVSKNNVIKLFQNTLAYLPRTGEDMPPYSDRTLTHLMNIYDFNEDEVGSNKWAVYNTATEWSSHVEDTMKATSQPHRVRAQREAKVASMMKSREWTALSDHRLAA